MLIQQQDSAFIGSATKLALGGGGNVEVKTLTTAQTELQDNTIYTADTLSAIDITIPATTDASYCSEIQFTCSNPATTFTCPTTILWKGDDVAESGGVLTLDPQPGTRYVIIFYKDGENIRAISDKR